MNFVSKTNNQRSVLYVEVALDVPLRQAFTYKIRDLLPAIGARVKVSFGRRKMIGVVIKHQATPPQNIKLKALDTVLDDNTLFSAHYIELLAWTARYYHHPMGEVWYTAMPGVLRKGLTKTHGLSEVFYALKPLPKEWQALLKRAPAQFKLLTYLHKQNSVVAHAVVMQVFPNARNARNALNALIQKNWLEKSMQLPALEAPVKCLKANTLDAAQASAVNTISQSFKEFKCYALQGVTGSGKTEVYFGLIDKVLKQKKQTLVMLPEIALTDQHFQRFTSRFGSQVAQIHSGMNDAARYRVWWLVKSGQISIVLATRSGVFIDFAKLGLIIVDEEHDLSYKQHEGLRYHARSVAIKRAQLHNIPIVLGSATPSLETVYNIEQSRYQHVELSARAQGGVLPAVNLINIANQKLDSGLSSTAIKEIKKTLSHKKQALVFINRRGYAPITYCATCQWIAQCNRCDANMTAHQHGRALQCHHCGASRAQPIRCESCHEESLITLGEGTQKIEQCLGQLFPNACIQRFDRDELNSAKKLKLAMQKVHDQEVDILIGTQLISKGHDFSALHLVVVVNPDQGLHSIDFRAPEHLVQQLIQVAGRAGRGKHQGQVLIQTNFVNHPAINAVTQHNYNQFIKVELEQRQLANFPPYSHIALWRVRSRSADQAKLFLQTVAEIGRQLQPENTFCFDPVKSPMFKRAGQFHMQLLISANARVALHQWLGEWILQVEGLNKRAVHWSIDIDPVSLI